MCERFHKNDSNYLIKIILNYLQQTAISVKIVNDKISNGKTMHEFMEVI